MPSSQNPICYRAGFSNFICRIGSLIYRIATLHTSTDTSLVSKCSPSSTPVELAGSVTRVSTLADLLSRAYRAWTAGEKGRNTLLLKTLDQPMALLRVKSEGKLDEVEAPLEGVDWQRLPPLLKRGAERRSEAFTGVGVVLGIVAACVAGTHAGVSLMSCVPDRAFRRWLPPLVYAEACIAILCLLGLMCDESQIRRSKATCAPTPPTVRTWLQLNDTSKGRKNVTGDDGRVYCVRCHVWRPRDSRAHHCATCQRCVTDFDHHCGVFGRCIHGSGLQGNMKYFVTVIAMGYAGAGTATAALVLGAIKCGPRQHWAASYTQFGLVALAAYAGLAITGWLVVLACRCAAGLVDCVAERSSSPRGLELV